MRRWPTWRARAAALLRAWLEVPSRAELAEVRRRADEAHHLLIAIGADRSAQREPTPLDPEERARVRLRRVEAEAHVAISWRRYFGTEGDAA